jgi:hypothetical protein
MMHAFKILGAIVTRHLKLVEPCCRLSQSVKIQYAANFTCRNEFQVKEWHW